MQSILQLVYHIRVLQAHDIPFPLAFEVNVFEQILNNPLFCSILLITFCLQVVIIRFGSIAFKVAEGDLDAKHWGFCLVLGAGSLPVQKVINVIYAFSMHYNGYRNRKPCLNKKNLATHSYNDPKGGCVEHGHEG